MTDTVAVDRTGWDRLRVVSVAPLLAGALRRFMADGAPGDLQA